MVWRYHKESTYSGDVATWFVKINTDQHERILRKSNGIWNFIRALLVSSYTVLLWKLPSQCSFEADEAALSPPYNWNRKVCTFFLPSLHLLKPRKDISVASQWTLTVLPISEPPSQGPFKSQPPSPDNSLLCIPDIHPFYTVLSMIIFIQTQERF